MCEVWKDINGYEGMYQVSNLGRIKSLSDRFGRERVLKLYNCTNNRYKSVYLYKNKERKYFSVHRIVAKAFIPNPKNKKEINHIDGNGFNNKVSNLEWVTKNENMKHAVLNGSMGRKLSIEDVKEIKHSLKYGGISRDELASCYGVSYVTICEIDTKKTWRHINV